MSCLLVLLLSPLRFPDQTFCFRDFVQVQTENRFRSNKLLLPKIAFFKQPRQCGRRLGKIPLHHPFEESPSCDALEGVRRSRIIDEVRQNLFRRRLFAIFRFRSELRKEAYRTPLARVHTLIQGDLRRPAGADARFRTRPSGAANRAITFKTAKRKAETEKAQKGSVLT